MKKSLGVILLSLAMVSSACSEEFVETEGSANTAIKTETTSENQNEQVPLLEPAIAEVGDQKINVFSYYRSFDHYLQLAKKDPDSLETSYEQTVIEPFQNNAFGEEESAEEIEYWFYTPPKDIIPLQSELQALSDREEPLHTAIDEALKKSAEMLPGSDKTVHVFPANPAYTHGKTQELNPLGVALEQGVMVLFVTPILLEEDLQHTIAHEYFHTVDMQRGTAEDPANLTLLEAVVMEGKAEAFAEIICPESELDWIADADEQITEATKMLFLKEKDSAEVEVWNDFYYGNAVAEVPIFASHMIGYDIMQSFLKQHPNMPVEEWLDLTAEEILAGSGYAEATSN
ncbi:hypothetical protein H1Q58_04090 [Planococcus maritimus]|uniref:DUF2268 domain-containing protein n=1 Tax=Planococcus maritimus TaxID=192421 RepID=A0A7D7MDH1_PLAMR|nr:DUF2268 domain-containing putative Zn-dependent protease [Planococcus maritimus]QMT18209.1 hypothetical protein H1Q58_04090 [Planococcus maritimus]